MSEMYFDIGTNTGAVEKALDSLKTKLDGVFKLAAKKLTFDADDKATKIIDEIASKSALSADSFNKMDIAIKQAGDSMEDLGKKAFNFNEIAESIGNFGAKLSEISQGGIELRDELANLQARTGATVDEMKLLEKGAKDLFVKGVGESVGEAVKIMANAKQVFGGVFDETNLETFTAGAAALGQVFDKDVTEVLNKSRTFVKQFGLDGQEAFNLISFGMQNSGSAQDDFLDTLDEYSPLMKKAGLDAQQFTAILANGMQLGAYNTDKLGDAIKETNIRIMEGDVANELGDVMAQLPTKLGETLKKTADLAKQGKISTAELMQTSAKAIGESFNSGEISDNLRDKLARAISGTPAEDLGGDLWTKVFSADIDPKAISDKAKAAGAQVANALGPVTFAEKIQKELALLWTNASQLLAPYAAQLGTVLSSVSQFAPALMLMKDLPIGNIKNMAVSLIGMLVPSLVTTTTVMEGTAAAATVTSFSFKALWKAITGPIGLVIGGVGLLVAAFKILYAKVEPFRKWFDDIWNEGVKKFDKLWNYVAEAVKNIGDAIGGAIKFVTDLFKTDEEIKLEAKMDEEKAKQEAIKAKQKVQKEMDKKPVIVTLTPKLAADAYKGIFDKLSEASSDAEGKMQLARKLKQQFGELKNSAELRSAIDGLKDVEQATKDSLFNDIEKRGGLKSFLASANKEYKKAKSELEKEEDAAARTKEAKDNDALLKIADIRAKERKLKEDLDKKSFIVNSENEKEIARQTIEDKYNETVKSAELAYKTSQKLQMDLANRDLAITQAQLDKEKALYDLNKNQRLKDIQEFVKSQKTVEDLRYNNIKQTSDSINDIYKDGYITEKLLEEKKLADLQIINATKEKTVIDFVKNTNEYQKKLENLQAKYTAGEIDVAEFDRQAQELIQIMQEGFLKGADPLAKAFQLTLSKANSEALKATKESDNTYYTEKQKLALTQITDLAELERKMNTLEAEKTYREATIKANGNRVLEKAAFESFLNSKLDIEEKYRKASENSMAKFTQSLVQNMTNAFSNAKFEFSTANDQEAKQKQLDDIKEQEQALKDSLKNNEISYEEYINKLNDLDKQRNEAMKDGLSKMETFWKDFNGFLNSVFQNMIDSNNNMLNEIVKSRQESQNKIIEIENLQAQIQDKNSKAYTDLETARKKETKNNTEATSQYYAVMATNVGLSMVDALVSGKNLAEEMPKILLDSLLKMIPVYIAQIYAKEIAAGSFLGIASAAGYTALLMGLVGAARVAVGAEEGVIGIDKTYNKKAGRTDTIPLMVAKGESIIKASATAKHRDLLQHINNGGELADFATYKLIQQPKIQLDNTNLINEIRGLKAEIKALKGNVNKVETLQNVNVKTDIPKRINVIVKNDLYRG